MRSSRTLPYNLCFMCFPGGSLGKAPLLSLRCGSRQVQFFKRGIRNISSISPVIGETGATGRLILLYGDRSELGSLASTKPACQAGWVWRRWTQCWAHGSAGRQTGSPADGILVCWNIMLPSPHPSSHHLFHVLLCGWASRPTVAAWVKLALPTDACHRLPDSLTWCQFQGGNQI